MGLKLGGKSGLPHLCVVKAIVLLPNALITVVKNCPKIRILKTETDPVKTNS